MSRVKTDIESGSIVGDLSSQRVSINKAYKMFVGGAFVRSESGRYFQVEGKGGADPEKVNYPRGSRKDIRDAVLIAKNALDGWSGRTAFNRSQILYRLAEVMESRTEELITSLLRSGISSDARAEVNASIDRTVYYAGFCDKYYALLASSNPVAGPHFGFSVPEPVGVIGIGAPETPSLLGLVSTVLPIIAGGNTCVAVASEKDPRTAVVFSECLATSDLPGGVANIVTGLFSELVPALSKHREVSGLDVWTNNADILAQVERDGADNIKRVKTHRVDGHPFATSQGLTYIENFQETKSVWHPAGL